MIDEKQLEELRFFVQRTNNRWQVSKEPDDWVSLKDLLDTIESLLKENASLKLVRDGLQKEVAGLEDNCKRWAERLEKLEAVARAAETYCEEMGPPSKNCLTEYGLWEKWRKASLR